ncbi:S8 family serine peptidase [Flavicella sp.]|uniref:S8 family serine peptidase n=1 Tax=Flavicella sp. TaxID=2957742 RepID=UPI003018E443
MKIISFLIILVTFSSFSQEEDAWVYFKDKPASNIYLNSPLLMLSQRAIERRENQGISFDLKDVPIEFSYISEIYEATGISVKAKSKWLNAVHVQGTQSNIELLLYLSSVNSIQFVNRILNKSVSEKSTNKFKLEKITTVNELNYGFAENQIMMLNGDFLHDMGYTGQGIQIAVLDAGFKGVETFNAFSNLHDNNTLNGEILGGYDFVNRNSNFYFDMGNTHGLSVLSTISGFIDSQFIGTAPDAQFYLFITEDSGSETPLEESLWVEAVEKADSLGVDIINTSLGYTTFDNSDYDYSYSDMDGQTTFISRGAEIACSRGMVLVTSAGNEGNSSWKYISAPADVSSVLTVGAVDENEVISFFSSYGPTADNRVKPEVLAQGEKVYIINNEGNIATSNGTSFSSPIMAGMVACLWQAFPSKSSDEIKELILGSTDSFYNPSSHGGYGIPNFESIYNLLDVDTVKSSEIKIYPNPMVNTLTIESNQADFSIKIFNLLGKLVYNKNSSFSQIIIDTSFLKNGMYILKICSEKMETTFKIIKK